MTHTKLDIFGIPSVDLSQCVSKFMTKIDNQCWALGTSYQQPTKRHEWMVVENESLTTMVDELYSVFLVVPTNYDTYFYSR